MKFFKKIKTFLEMVSSAFYFVFLAQLDFTDFLIVKGEILNCETKTDEKRQVVTVSAKAEMQAINNKNGLVTLVKPKYFVQSKIKYFATTKQACSRYTNLYSSLYADDVLNNNEELANLESDLKNGKMPDEFIFKLKPGEKHLWEEKIYFEFELKEKTRKWKGVSWCELLEKGNSFWFQFEYRLPKKFELLKPRFFALCDEIWKDDGEIPVARVLVKEFKTKLIFVETQPIFIDFSNPN